MKSNDNIQKVIGPEFQRSREVVGEAPLDWIRFASHSPFPYYLGWAWKILDERDRYAKLAREDERVRQERLLDAGLEETFPASDPVAVMRLT